MPVNPDRLAADFAAIGRITQTPGQGATRPTFSKEWGEARDYVIARGKAIDCAVRIDSAGNVFMKPARLGADVRTWLVGSHIDTVPHGGDYDGVTGVLAGLELLRSAHDEQTLIAVELVIFAEEEGPTFGLGMLGSRALVGEISAEQLGQLTNSAGQSYLEAGKPFGVDPARLGTDRLDASKHLGLIELHIEQGPGMWRRDQRLAIVTAIAGRQQYRVTLTGDANHAGATSMDDRKDALAAAAEIVVGLEKLAKRISPAAVATVGRLNVSPNAINVIPDRVEFTIDFRAPTDDQLRAGDTAIADLVRDVCLERLMPANLKRTEAIPARPMDARLVVALDQNLPVAVSGALHDSAVIAPHLPTVMLFVPSEGGISHNPAEFSRVEDIAAAVAHIERLVRRPTLELLNASDSHDAVKFIGGIYEHSPWIVERAWAKRPFRTFDALRAALRDVVEHATEDERMSLIRAHPDLVGRLARENRMTRESAHEQSAAGLTALSADEIEAFERYNAAYRERFGFPFIICARQNRKEAILAAFPERMKNTRDEETQRALVEIHKIAELRLRDATWGW
jgi:allantoate deiminase